MAYNPNEPRDEHGRWAFGTVAGAIKKAAADKRNQKIAFGAGRAATEAAVAAALIATTGPIVGAVISSSLIGAVESAVGDHPKLKDLI